MEAAQIIPDEASERSGEDRYGAFESGLRGFIPAGRIITDPLGTLAHGTDASFYRLTPRVVLLVETEAEVARVCALAERLAVPLTFRAAGTSLSGQAVTDSVLVKLGHDGWRGFETREDGSLARVGPGLTGGQVNARLAPLGRKIGPDPASINSAMIGGIAANNASGMCCGVAQNSYKTVEAMRIVLADGTVLDTGDDESRAIFRQSHAELLNGLQELGERTRADAALAARIRKKFSIKNTLGYSLNALVDFEDPFDILAHLMIGSEGTLGFMSEITYRTVEDPRHKASALIFFPDMRTACEAVALLKQAPVAAVELMDDRSLRSVEDQPGMPETIGDFTGAAALLVEVQGASETELAERIEAAGRSIEPIETLAPHAFTDDPAACNRYWAIRKGLFPSVGAVRETGTTVIIEDVAVETPKLADAVLDLQGLFDRHGYAEGIIFGHALDGNVHFVFTQAFDTPEEVERYGAFMDDVAELIVGTYDGSLKAEHSTGRNMAPFVEMEWGRDAHALMREIKDLLDPAGVLNPGVILNDDPRVHLKDLKPLPAAHAIVDKCIECGFCEPSCPSRALTLTPRQRIAGLRELARLKDAGTEAARRASIEKLYAYQGVDSCAGDGLCGLSCPVGIDTGRMMRELRHDKTGAFGRRVAGLLAGRFATVSSLVRLGLLGAGLARTLLGDGILTAASRGLSRLTRGGTPLWTPFMPAVAAPHQRTMRDPDRPDVVYFPSCAARVFAPSPREGDRRPLPAVVDGLLRKAGYNVLYPERLQSLCCGQPFESKGYFEAAERKISELGEALHRASDGGACPVVLDTGPCAQRARQALAGEFRTYDLVEALDELVMDRVALEPSDTTVALHATCSARRMGLDGRLAAIASACAGRVIAPLDIECCGFAGDKGFTVPELNANALRHLADQLPDVCTHGYSTSRTCEIGLSTHAGRPYASIAYLVDHCARPLTETSGEQPEAGA